MENAILVGFDGSANGNAAVAWAVAEAQVRGLEVEVLSVLQVPALAYGAPGFIPPTMDKFQQEMQPVLSALLSGLVDGKRAVRLLGVIVSGLTSPDEILRARQIVTPSLWQDE